MRLLDRYLTRELIVPLIYCLGGFLIFWISFDLFGELKTYQKARLSWPEIFTFYGVRLPELLVLLLPIALLLALLYALTSHSRHHELTAIRAAGVSLGRMCLPYFAVGLLLSVFLFALNEWAVPDGAEAAERILNRHSTAARTQKKEWLKNVTFHNGAEDRTWKINAYNTRTKEMLNVQIFSTQADGMRRELYAERGWRTNGMWVFTNVHQFKYMPGPQALPQPLKHDVMKMPELTETPRLIKSEIKIASLEGVRAVRKAQLSISEIISYLSLHPMLDRGRGNLLRTQLHNRIATPWTPLVVVLIAIPFGAAGGRRNVFVGVASSIVICFSYFVMRELSLVLGVGGYVPAWVAAWAPNLLFAALGLVLMLRLR